MDEFEFEGFDVPGTTPVPDVVFDKLLSRLTGNELKVLLYIIRRTYGFGKNADAISLSQFREGIKTRDENGDEKVLDEGCGIGHNRTILVALASLEQKGCVTSKKRNTNAGDSDTTIYKLRFKSASKKASKAQSDNGVVTSGNHVVTPGNEGSYSTSPRWLPEVTTVVTSGNTQETVLQYTVKQETVLQGDTYGASIDSAALTPQEKIAKLEALIEELKKALPHQSNVQNTTPFSTDPAKGDAFPTTAGQNDTPLTPAGNSTTPPEQDALQSAVGGKKQPCVEGSSTNTRLTQDKPSVAQYNASEMPPSTQAVNGTSNQATEQPREQQESGKSPIARNTTNKRSAAREMSDRLKKFYDTFTALGQEFFEDDTFKADYVYNKKDPLYKDVVALVTDGATPKDARMAFEHMWNEEDKDGTHFWQDPACLTTRAFVKHFRSKLASAKFKKKQIEREEAKNREPNQKIAVGAGKIITSGPLAGQPDYDADPWS